MTSTAQKILTVSDRTPKERLQMADFYSSRFVWEKDFYAVTFDDGSTLAFVLDEDMHPTEILEL